MDDSEFTTVRKELRFPVQLLDPANVDHANFVSLPNDAFVVPVLLTFLTEYVVNTDLLDVDPSAGTFEGVVALHNTATEAWTFVFRRAVFNNNLKQSLFTLNTYRKTHTQQTFSIKHAKKLPKTGWDGGRPIPITNDPTRVADLLVKGAYFDHYCDAACNLCPSTLRVGFTVQDLAAAMAKASGGEAAYVPVYGVWGKYNLGQLAIPNSKPKHKENAGPIDLPTTLQASSQALPAKKKLPCLALFVPNTIPPKNCYGQQGCSCVEGKSRGAHDPDVAYGQLNCYDHLYYQCWLSSSLHVLTPYDVWIRSILEAGKDKLSSSNRAGMLNLSKARQQHGLPLLAGNVRAHESKHQLGLLARDILRVKHAHQKSARSREVAREVLGLPQLSAVAGTEDSVVLGLEEATVADAFGLATQFNTQAHDRPRAQQAGAVEDDTMADLNQQSQWRRVAVDLPDQREARRWRDAFTKLGLAHTSVKWPNTLGFLMDGERAKDGQSSFVATFVHLNGGDVCGLSDITPQKLASWCSPDVRKLQGFIPKPGSILRRALTLWSTVVHEALPDDLLVLQDKQAGEQEVSKRLGHLVALVHGKGAFLRSVELLELAQFEAASLAAMPAPTGGMQLMPPAPGNIATAASSRALSPATKDQVQTIIGAKPIKQHMQEFLRPLVPRATGLSKLSVHQLATKIKEYHQQQQKKADQERQQQEVQQLRLHNQLLLQQQQMLQLQLQHLQQQRQQQQQQQLHLPPYQEVLQPLQHQQQHELLLLHLAGNAAPHRLPLGSMQVHQPVTSAPQPLLPMAQ